MNEKMQLLLNFSTPIISDALDILGINGGLEGITPLISGQRIVGEAFTLEFKEVKEGEMGPAAEFIDEVEKGKIIVISNHGRDFCTVWGGILTYVAQQRGIAGCIIDGACRDIDEIKQANFPMFCRTTYMKSGKNRVYLSSKQQKIQIENTAIFPGDIICADDSGVLCFPYNKIDEVLTIAQQIKDMEERIILDLEQLIPLKEARIRHNYNKFSKRLS
ncbi:MAG: RraA family protein [Proteobacteria bacterium]|nr:RraA family protein [Pseudomonadota bacterium]